MNTTLKYLMLFLAILLLVDTFLYFEKESKIKDHMTRESAEIEAQYKAIYREYKEISHIIFDTNINKKDVINIFKRADTNDTLQQNEIRLQLYKQLQGTYALLQKYNLKQLHFHLPNNDSFLRFHRPEKFGDNLTNIRSTVAYTNQNLEYIDGFEEGRIYNGYRYVYPLFDETKKHIGSVEISFSTLAFNEEFFYIFHSLSHFLILKDVVEKKVFTSEQKNYLQSPLEHFYIEKKSLEALEQLKHKDNASSFTQDEQKEIHEHIIKGEKYSFYNENYEFTFLPVKNPITKQVVATFVSQHKHHYIPNKYQNYYITLITSNILFAIIIYLLYRNEIKNQKITQERQRLGWIFNEANSGIGLIDLEGNFIEVNSTYCTLLGYEHDELITKSCIDISIPEGKEHSLELLKNAIKCRHLSKVEKKCVTKEGKVLPVEISLDMLPSNDAFTIVMNPIEERIKLKKLNQDLQHEVDKAVEEIRLKDNILFQQSKDAAMGEMIDAIAHQWINPLGIVRLLSQDIKYESKEDDINGEIIIDDADKIELQVNHLLDTLSEFRSFFRPNAQRKEITLSNLFSSVKVLMKDELLKNTMSIELIGDLESSVYIAPNEFKHVLINLITNSRDAFNEREIKGERKISYEVEDLVDKTILKISDNAGGIKDEIIDHIFDANFTTKEEGKGTGIGLYMTKQILDKIDAQVQVYNISGGVCFEITIPKLSQKED